MKNKRELLFRLGVVVVLLAIAAVMMVIGRGHTVYFDSRALEYDGKTYETPYKIVVLADGKQVAKLYDGERGMAVTMGQSFSMTLEITEKKGGSEETKTCALSLPYNMDGIIINLPGYLAGLPEEAYLTEFVQTPVEEAAPEAPVIDEFGITDDEESSAA